MTACSRTVDGGHGHRPQLPSTGGPGRRAELRDGDASPPASPLSNLTRSCEAERPSCGGGPLRWCRRAWSDERPSSSSAGATLLPALTRGRRGRHAKRRRRQPPLTNPSRRPAGPGRAVVGLPAGWTVTWQIVALPDDGEPIALSSPVPADLGGTPVGGRRGPAWLPLRLPARQRRPGARMADDQRERPHRLHPFGGVDQRHGHRRPRRLGQRRRPGHRRLSGLTAPSGSPAVVRSTGQPAERHCRRRSASRPGSAWRRCKG